MSSEEEIKFLFGSLEKDLSHMDGVPEYLRWKYAILNSIEVVEKDEVKSLDSLLAFLKLYAESDDEDIRESLLNTVAKIFPELSNFLIFLSSTDSDSTVRLFAALNITHDSFLSYKMAKKLAEDEDDEISELAREVLKDNVHAKEESEAIDALHKSMEYWISESRDE